MRQDEDKIKVRLKVSGQSVDPLYLPDNLVSSISTAFKDGKDPFAVLATFAYIFCGLKINDIKDMVILSDRSGTRTASREYIRQKIVATFRHIKRIYIEEHGITYVSPLFRLRNLDPSEVTMVSDGRYDELFEGDNSGESYEDTREGDDQLSEEESHETPDLLYKHGTSTKRSEEGNNNERGSGYSASWLVDLKSRLHTWWDKE